MVFLSYPLPKRHVLQRSVKNPRGIRNDRHKHMLQDVVALLSKFRHLRRSALPLVLPFLKSVKHFCRQYAYNQFTVLKGGRINPL